MGRAARFPKSLCRSRKETAAIKNNHAPRPAGGYSPAGALCAGGTRFISWEPWYGAGRSAWGNLTGNSAGDSRSAQKIKNIKNGMIEF